MLSFSGSLKVFVALEACDHPRKVSNGLHTLVTERLQEDPRAERPCLHRLGGARGSGCCWDGTGLWSC